MRRKRFAVPPYLFAGQMFGAKLARFVQEKINVRKSAAASDPVCTIRRHGLGQVLGRFAGDVLR